MYKKRVVIVESDADFAKIYSHLVDGMSSLELVGSYTGINDALMKIRLDRPDLIVIGLAPPQYSDIDLIRKLFQADDSVKVILISEFLENNLLFKSINYGVLGFLLRTSSLVELEEAFETVAAGGGFLNGKVTKKLIDSHRKNSASPLTSRETEVLNLLAQGKTYSMIADEMSIAGGTAKIHIKNIYEKLGVTSKAEAIAKAREIKLIN